VRRRARNGFQTERGRLTIALTESERHEVGRLLGLRWETSSQPVQLRYLAAALADHQLTVRAYVEALDRAPLIDLRQRKRDQRAAALAEREVAKTCLTASGVAAAAAEAWLDDASVPCGGTGELLAFVEKVVGLSSALRRDSESGLWLAQLAAITFGDAHALDYDQALGKASSRLIALVHGLPKPVRGREWRAAWAAAGVRCDTVSSRALTLNLPLRGGSPAMRWCGATGEPLWLTLHALASDWAAPAGVHIFVCENPTVLESAADKLGAQCPPMVCTDGIPTLAVIDLVAGLADAGCLMHVRADFDVAGFGIVEQLRGVAPAAELWRFDEATYLSFASSLAEDLDRSGQLRQLFDLVKRPVHEEALLDVLLADLVKYRV
jgi:uncharacterized protein (TIGR02679 family)